MSPAEVASVGYSATAMFPDGSGHTYPTVTLGVTFKTVPDVDAGPVQFTRSQPLLPPPLPLLLLEPPLPLASKHSASQWADAHERSPLAAFAASQPDGP